MLCIYQTLPEIFMLHLLLYTVSYLYIYTLTQLNLHTINKSVVLYSAFLILEYYTFVYISGNYHSAHLECPNLKNINRKLTFNLKKKNSVIHNGCVSTYEIKKNETKLLRFFPYFTVKVFLLCKF